MKNKSYDVIVVGAGHAGCEASLAAARMGCHTLLITLHKDKIALMSCNPAIGGVGKGQLVKELDALGGEMAKATDKTAIQFRTLNTSKGPAVWSSRAQVGRMKYCNYMQNIVINQKNLEVYEGEAIKLINKNKVVEGVETDKGEIIKAKTVIITTGTFLNGLIHIGMRSFDGGRLEEKQASKSLSDSLKDLGFRLLRFNTCTSARLDGKTIDFSKLKAQEGDNPPRPFSLSTKSIDIKQVPCYITYTNEKTHDIIRRNLDRTPFYSGKVKSPSVRYCPSFEDKIVKFPHHERHQIFLEPEGLDTDEYYPNGFFTGLPEDVQLEFIHTVAGLENVKVNRAGYGIEYDISDPTQLYPTLETKLIKNLYLAGQINGTTGYEEAAAQGLVAGINAALRVKDKTPLVLDRSSSYIGVLIDDLVTKGTDEPYRMFTSRVEYRLILREDNVDLRLRKIGHKTGLVTKQEYQETLDKQMGIEEGIKYLKANSISLNGIKVNLFQFLKRPENKIEDVKEKLPFDYPENVFNGIEIEVKYSGFIQRQVAEVKSFKNLEKIKIPQNLVYDEMPALSLEIKEKLSKFRPMNLGHASRISGVTPAAISILMVYLKKFKENSGSKNNTETSK